MRKELKLSSADCQAAAAGLSTTAGGVERGAGSPWRQLRRVPRSPRQRGPGGTASGQSCYAGAKRTLLLSVLSKSTVHVLELLAAPMRNRQPAAPTETVPSPLSPLALQLSYSKG